MFNNKEIGNKIKNLRKINGYTQEEIAEKLDIGDRIKISRIENGKQSMTDGGFPRQRSLEVPSALEGRELF